MDTSLRTAALPPTMQIDAPTVFYAQEKQRVQGAHHEHHHTHAHRGERKDKEGTAGPAYATLKVKIEETFTRLASASDTAPTSDGVDAEFKTRIAFSGSGGKVEASFKLSVDGDSGTAAADFASALKGFTDALFSALKTLYGSEPAGTPAASGPSGPSSTASPAVVSGALAAPPVALPPTPEVVTNPPGVGETPAADTRPISTTPVAPGSSSSSSSGSGSGSGSLSIKLRYTYNSFDSQIGPLVNQLAQPAADKTSAAMGELLSELSARFGQLLAAGNGGGAAQPTLGSFLSALSQSFTPNPPKSSEPASATPEPVVDTAGGGFDTATAAPSTPRFSATMDYQQVLNFGDTTASFSLHARTSSNAVYAVA